MKEIKSIDRELLLAAAALGVTGDLLLRAIPWGVNAAVWIGLVVATAFGLAVRSGRLSVGSTVRPRRGSVATAGSNERSSNAGARGSTERRRQESADLPAGFRSEHLWLLLTAGLAGLFVWRASPFLAAGTTLAVATGLSLVLYHAQSEKTDEAPGFLASNLRAAAGLPFFLLGTLQSRDRSGARGAGTASAARMGKASGTGTGRAAGTGARSGTGTGNRSGRGTGHGTGRGILRGAGEGMLRGLLVAAPAILIFGALLVSADVVFERLVRRTLGDVFDNLPSHVVLFVILSGLSTSFLFGLLYRPGPIRLWPQDAPPSMPAGPNRGDRVFELGVTEISVVLGLVDVLFAVFVALQLPYLFGGASVVASTEGLTIAEYARRGFFELTVVACLAVPMLLALYHLFRPDSDRDRLVFRFLSAVQLVLLGVMLASAGQRIWLYQNAFGWTLLRIYACAVMLWLLFGFAWFAATVLRDRPRGFLPGAAAAGIAVIIGLHLVNPAATIVKANAARALAGNSFEIEQDVYRDADAVPALLDVLPGLPVEDQSAAAAALLDRWSQDTGGDWRSWNAARIRARHHIRQAIPMLEQFAAEGAGRGPAKQAGPR